MKNFKIGDRVRVFGLVDVSDSRPLHLYGKKGTITEYPTSDEIFILLDKPHYLDNDLIISAHPNQCKKLKIKPKRRQAWVNDYEDGFGTTLYDSKKSAKSEAGPGAIRQVRLIEVRNES